MQAVITRAEARKILKGRTPHVPVEYEQAVTALDACIKLDDAKYWSNAADALAAWAKMYRDDKVGRQAKMLKLHAYRKMGLLAEQLNPQTRKQGEGVGKGSVEGSGPRSLLIGHGLTIAETSAARSLARLPEKRFNEILKDPCSPTTVRSRLFYAKQWHYTQAALMGLRSRCRHDTPAQLAAEMTAEERRNARELVTEIIEWLDDFEGRLK